MSVPTELMAWEDSASVVQIEGHSVKRTLVELGAFCSIKTKSTSVPSLAGVCHDIGEESNCIQGQDSGLA